VLIISIIHEKHITQTYVFYTKDEGKKLTNTNRVCIKNKLVCIYIYTHWIELNITVL